MAVKSKHEANTTNKVSLDPYTIIGLTLTDAIKRTIMSAPEPTFNAIKRGMDDWVADRTTAELGESVIRNMRNFIRMREEEWR